MNVTLYNQLTNQTENVVLSTLDDLKTLSEVYFGIMPDKQLFSIDGRPIDMNLTLDNVGLKANDMVVVSKSDDTNITVDDDNSKKSSDPLNQTIFDVTEQMFVDSSIPYTLLYLSGETNDIAFRIIIDTGAAASVMSESLSKTLKINTLIDDRSKGTAVGIGNTKILGMITGCNVKISNDMFVPVNFSVLEDGFDKYMAILGLDFLTSHKCKIDFSNRTIEVNGTLLKFLNEMEVQNMQVPYNVIEHKLSSNLFKFSDSLINKSTSLELLKKIIKNIIDNPNDDKFKKINSNSKMIKELNSDSSTFLNYLSELGFKPDNVETHRYCFNGSLSHLVFLDNKLKN